jgi:YrbI family 3-deoxy-D-manno-octulosonate 8-phosphate phosphatase
MNSATDKLKDIRMLAMDFDGVLTDNRVFFSEDGKESVICSRTDSLGIRMLKEKRKDISIVVISKEKSKVVAARCDKLGIESHSGIDEKLSVLKKAAEEKGVGLAHVAYIGNDLNDLECIRHAGIGIAVADSVPEILKAAAVVTKNKGGLGAVREVTDMLISGR